MRFRRKLRTLKRLFPCIIWTIISPVFTRPCASLRRFHAYSRHHPAEGPENPIAASPQKRLKTRRPNPSRTNLRPQNRRAEWLAFRFRSFYFAADGLGKTLDFRHKLATLNAWLSCF